MEDKLKKRKIKSFIYGCLGYICGAAIYDLLFSGGNNKSRVIFAILFSIVIRALLDFYEYRKYPKLKEKEEQLEKDERLVMIKYKAAYVTYIIILFILVISWLFTLGEKYYKLNNFITIMVLVAIVVMQLSKYYLNRKM